MYNRGKINFHLIQNKILQFKFINLAALTIFSLTFCSPRTDSDYDIVVYGGTSAGVIAAVQAKKLGKSTIIIEQGNHLGGLTSGGLGATDIGNKAAIGGLSREFLNIIIQSLIQIYRCGHLNLMLRN